MEEITYEIATVVFESDSTTIDSLVQQTVPVGVDDDGLPVVVYNDYGSIGYSEPAPVDKPLPPVLSLERSSATYAFEDNDQAYTTSITVSWEPAAQVDHYKVFCTIDSSNGLLQTDNFNTGGDAFSAYTTGPLFQLQSEKVLPNVKYYNIDLSEFKYSNRFNVFVFAYNRQGRSDFPPYMITVRAKDRSYNLLAKMYLEKTSYCIRDQPPIFPNYLYFLDDTEAKVITSNVNEKDMSYQEPVVYLPE